MCFSKQVSVCHDNCGVAFNVVLKSARQTAIEILLMPLSSSIIQSNGPLYIDTVIGTLAVGGWAVTFGTAMMGLGGLGTCPVPSLQYQM